MKKFEQRKHQKTLRNSSLPNQPHNNHFVYLTKHLALSSAKECLDLKIFVRRVSSPVVELLQKKIRCMLILIDTQIIPFKLNVGRMSIYLYTSSSLLLSELSIWQTQCYWSQANNLNSYLLNDTALRTCIFPLSVRRCDYSPERVDGATSHCLFS